MPAVTIHTGNLLEVTELKRRPGHTPADELLESLTIVLKKDNNVQVGIKEGVVCNGLPRKLDPEQRANQKITAKLFLPKVTQGAVDAALTKVLEELGVIQVDLFLLSWPGDTDPTSEDGKALWSQVESAVSSGKALSVGVSDMDTQQFVSLYHSASVKPEAVQINLEVCCVVPPELATFTRENSIQLLTHNDPQNILTSEKLKEIDPVFDDIDWVIRYQTLWRCRGILENKGYIILTRAH